MNSQSPACLCLPSVDIKGMHHRRWVSHYYFNLHEGVCTFIWVPAESKKKDVISPEAELMGNYELPDMDVRN